MYVRWLGAFRSVRRDDGRGLAASFKYEVQTSYFTGHQLEQACEKVRNKSEIRQAQIGLLVDPDCITKSFNGDCFSKRQRGKQSLVKTRNPRKPKSKHLESWVSGNWIQGVVLKKPLDQFKKEVQEQIRFMASALPVYLLKEGAKRARLIELNVEPLTREEVLQYADQL